MSSLSEFTRRECDYFRRECNFTRDERAVFDLRVSGASIVEIALALSMSTATVNRRLRAVKTKIYRVL